MKKQPSLLPNPHAEKPEIRPLPNSLGFRTVRRRDFLNGLLVGASAAVLGASASGCDDGGTDPIDELPPGSYKGDNNTICHQVRDGKMFDFPAAEGDLYDAIVIGGGISGLCAAYKLQKLGVANVLVLEKEDPVGGFSSQDGPAESPWGQAAAYTVFPYNDNLIEIYTDLGVIKEIDADGVPVLNDQFVLKEPVNSAFIDGKWYPEAWDKGIDGLPFSDQVKADLKAFRDDMIEWYNYADAEGKFAFDTPSDASTEEPDVRALDNVSFADYITKTKGWSQEVSDFYIPYCRSAFGVPPEELSAWAAINFFGSEFQPSMSQPGGNAYLAKKFADLVGAANIQTKCFVLRAKNEGDEVHVTYLKDNVSKTIRAKAAVYAGPRYLAKYVLPDLVAAGRNEAKDFHYTPYIVAAVHVDKTPPDIGYDNWIQDEKFFTDIIVADWAGLADPANEPLTRKNTLSCYCPLPSEANRGELLSTPFEDYEKKILEDLEIVFPGIRETVTGVDIYRWGHAMLQSRVGFVFGPSRVGSQVPEGRISFANTDVDGLPAFENAVASAFRAAQEVAMVVFPPP
ncbi:MAG: FAD-dependent oxidoreductase [Polyangiaceae bacterium]|nr:FAD-dependent oxidoreductase [Polyangiaceae bacterium]